MTRFWIRNLTSRNDSRTGRLGHQARRGAAGGGAAGPPESPDRPGAGGAGVARRRADAGSSALDPLQQGHRINPFRAARATVTDVHHRHANSDFFGAALRAVSAGVGDRARPTTAWARRRMSWETCASRLERKNGTPRLRA